MISIGDSLVFLMWNGCENWDVVENLAMELGLWEVELKDN